MLASGESMEISVLLVSRGESSTRRVLESVLHQRYQDWEVIIADSSRKSDAWLPTDDPRVHHVTLPKDMGLLEARMIAAQHASGLYSLMLDSTRVLTETCLMELSRMTNIADMVVVRERSIGTSFWARMAALDKSIVMSEVNIRRAMEGMNGVVLPRFFRTKLLNSAYTILRERIPKQLFRQIVFNDHQLVFGAATEISRSISVSANPLIFHIEDSSLRGVLRKYYRYGASQAVMASLPSFGYARRFMDRRRSYAGVSLRYVAGVQPLYMARGVGFTSGYLQGRISARFRRGSSP